MALGARMEWMGNQARLVEESTLLKDVDDIAALPPSIEWPRAGGWCRGLLRVCRGREAIEARGILGGLWRGNTSGKRLFMPGQAATSENTRVGVLGDACCLQCCCHRAHCPHRGVPSEWCDADPVGKVVAAVFQAFSFAYAANGEIKK